MAVNTWIWQSVYIVSMSGKDDVGRWRQRAVDTAILAADLRDSDLRLAMWLTAGEFAAIASAAELLACIEALSSERPVNPVKW